MKISELSEHHLEIIKNPEIGHSDAARCVNFTRDRIKSIRRRLGVKLKKNPFAGRKWSSEEDKMLKMYPTSVIAKKLGLKPDLVRTRRRKLGIPAFKGHGPKICPHCGKEI